LPHRPAKPPRIRLAEPSAQAKRVTTLRTGALESRNCTAQADDLSLWTNFEAMEASMIYFLIALSAPATLFIFFWLWALSENHRKIYLLSKTRKKDYFPIRAEIVDQRMIKNRFHAHKRTWVHYCTIYLLRYQHEGRTYEVQYLDEQQVGDPVVIEKQTGTATLYIKNERPADAHFERPLKAGYFHICLGLALYLITWVATVLLIQGVGH